MEITIVDLLIFIFFKFEIWAVLLWTLSIVEGKTWTKFMSREWQKMMSLIWNVILHKNLAINYLWIKKIIIWMVSVI